MRQFIIIITLHLSLSPAFGQVPVPDLALTGCDGAVHYLKSDLDNGRIIVLQFINQLTAASLNSLQNAEQITAAYKAGYDDLVYTYAVSSEAEMPCDEMPDFMPSSVTNYLWFESSGELNDHFRITGFPALVVLGTNGHVYGVFQSYSVTREHALKAAIEEAITEAGENGGAAIIRNSLGTVFPNPFTGSLNVRLNPASVATRAAVCDLTGKSLLAKEFTSEKLINFNTSSLQKGIYFLNFYQGSKITGTLKLVKRQ